MGRFPDDEGRDSEGVWYVIPYAERVSTEGTVRLILMTMAILAALAFASTPLGVQSSAVPIAQSTVVPPSALTCLASTEDLRVVRIRRTSPALLPKRFAMSPLRRTIQRRRAAVIGLYRAVCGLPLVDTRLLHCPGSFGVAYHLAFTWDNGQVEWVTWDATGCRSLYPGSNLRIGGPTYGTLPPFWRLLAHALRLPEKKLFPTLP